jgi:uncharacterized protein (UPF0332 family)
VEKRRHHVLPERSRGGNTGMKAEVRGFLDKAERMLRAAEILHRENDPESAVGRAYYAMLHTAQALFFG